MNSSACLQTTVLIEDHAEGFTFPEIKTLPGCAVDYYFFFFSKHTIFDLPTVGFPANRLLITSFSYFTSLPCLVTHILFAPLIS